MQLTTYVETLSIILTRLKVVSIIESLERLLFTRQLSQSNPSIGPEKDVLIASLFNAREELAFHMRDKEVARVAQAHGLTEVFKVAAIADVVVMLREDSLHNIRNVPAQFQALSRLYWALKQLTLQENVLRALIVDERKTAVEANESVLEFEVLELGQSGFDPHRLAKILPELEQLFVGIALGLGMPHPTIRIAYADSGSDLIIAIKAAKDLIPEVRKFMLDVLVFIRDRKADQLSKRVKAAGEAVDFCAKVKAREKEKTISGEDADRAIHTAVTAATELLEYGTALREMKKTESFDQLKLLEAVAVKALPAPADQGDSVPKAPE